MSILTSYDIESHFAMELAKALAQKKDSLIRGAVLARLGHEIPDADLFPRMRAELQPNRSTIWFLDDRPLVETHLPTTGCEDGKMTASFQYRLLP